MYFSVSDCEKRLKLLYETEEKILSGGKSYTIDNRSLQRVELSDVQKSISLWENRLAKARVEANGRSRRRTMRIVPRDL